MQHKIRAIGPYTARAAAVLHEMGNERRLRILGYLAGGEKNVTELQTLIGDLSQGALSQHLARLRRVQVVQTRREAQTIFYSLRGTECLAVLQAIQAHYQVANAA